MKKLVLTVSLILVSSLCYAGVGHITTKSVSTSTQPFVTAGVSKTYTHVNLTNACTNVMLINVIGVSGSTITSYRKRIVPASTTVTIEIPDLDILGFNVIVDSNTPTADIYTNKIFADVDYR